MATTPRADAPNPRQVLILNVDDTDAIRYAKTRALKSAGYAVIEASGGREALDLVASARPALALLDVKLPDMSGIEVCKIIKRDFPGTLVLQISATFRTSSDRAFGLQAGADSYLTQPVSPGELAAAVEALLRMRRAEEELRNINEQLEQRVNERTEALRREIEERRRVEAALAQSQKMEAVGRLTGGIAHDFNNLLMAVLGNLEILDKRLGEGRTDVGAYASNARDAAERAAALTQRLLAFSRRQPLRAAPADIEAVFRGMDAIIQASVGAGVALRFDVVPGVWQVWCDTNQFENALLNLVINARDAMPRGGEVWLSARNEVVSPEAAAGANPAQHAGEYVRVSVRDNGEGMAPDVLAQAFEPFFTTKPQGKGTGLGLSMIYGFVQQSRGFAEISSEIGVGTEVSMLLPRARTHALPTDQAATPLSEPGVGVVLVVEDEALIRILMVEALTEQGYHCLEADDALQALELGDRGETFDLLLTDAGLPGGLDGRELAARMKAQRPDLKAVLISGHAGRDDHDAFDAYLQKPFNMNELVSVVARVLEPRATG
ncbi:MAG TPA: response regulator [Caulobacteraceae bacterium]|jgi:signal transduction histidine kinase|nr:response regulator [Caulobacteraceae bacterium]